MSGSNPQLIGSRSNGWFSTSARHARRPVRTTTVHYAASAPAPLTHFGLFAYRAVQCAVSLPPSASIGQSERFLRRQPATNRSFREFSDRRPLISPDLRRQRREYRVVSGRGGGEPLTRPIPNHCPPRTSADPSHDRSLRGICANSPARPKGAFIGCAARNAEESPRLLDEAHFVGALATWGA